MGKYDQSITDILTIEYEEIQKLIHRRLRILQKCDRTVTDLSQIK